MRKELRGGENAISISSWKIENVYIWMFYFACRLENGG